jgi:hypothetical protein
VNTKIAGISKVNGSMINDMVRAMSFSAMVMCILAITNMVKLLVKVFTPGQTEINMRETGLMDRSLVMVCGRIQMVTVTLANGS